MEQSIYYKKITPEHKWYDLRLKVVWRYRDLVMLLVKRDFVAKYKQTILGPAWAVIQPLLTTVVFTFIFGAVAGLADSGSVPTFLFYMCGNIAWQFFAGCLSKTGRTFVDNRGIMEKVYFPRMAMPISTCFSQLVAFLIQAAMFAAFVLIYLFVPRFHIQITKFIIFVPLFVLQMMMLGMGCGIIICALTTKYRDLQMLIDFGVQLWMYATPVAYSIKLFEGTPFLYRIVNYNPMTPVINAMRYACLGPDCGRFDLKYYLISLAMTIGILIIGMMLYNKAEKNFTDTV